MLDSRCDISRIVRAARVADARAPRRRAAHPSHTGTWPPVKRRRGQLRAQQVRHKARATTMVEAGWRLSIVEPKSVRLMSSKWKIDKAQAEFNGVADRRLQSPALRRLRSPVLQSPVGADRRRAKARPQTYRHAGMVQDSNRRAAQHGKREAQHRTMKRYAFEREKLSTRSCSRDRADGNTTALGAKTLAGLWRGPA